MPQNDAKTYIYKPINVMREKNIYETPVEKLTQNIRKKTDFST